MLTIILCLALGVALAYVVPTGVEPGIKYRAPTESDFQELLRCRGVSE